MQQAYQALRVISEAQTVHIVLSNRPGALVLEELSAACQALQIGSSEGIKAVVLDFAEATTGVQQSEMQQAASGLVERCGEAVRAIPQPVLAVARASLSEIACRLLAEADFTLVDHEAELHLPTSTLRNARESGDQKVLQYPQTNRVIGGSLAPPAHNGHPLRETSNGPGDVTIGGVAAARLGYATWCVPAASLNQELERILDMFRSKSAVALRHAKASVQRPNQVSSRPPLDALRQTNQFYLEDVMATQDAREGLQAFLEKRAPRWNNR